MEWQSKYITADIKLSEYSGNAYSTETLFDHHMLVWFISGETRIIRSEGSYIFKAGDIFLIPRNQLATIINTPGDGKPNKSVVMHLTTDRLKEFYAEHRPRAPLLVSPAIVGFGHHPLLESCLASLIPYFDLQGQLPVDLATLKINEAIHIIRGINPAVDGVLANFEEPGKIDLAGFMERNFIFNLPLEKFARLTGRSVSTFGRDFKKIFQTTPQRWLTQRRLEFAHYQIREKRRKPVDVYLEAGFMDLSHFSFAFKKRYGYPPGEVG